MGTASRSVEILPLPQPKAVAKSAGGPTAPGRKRTLSGWKLVNVCYSNLCGTNGLRLLVTRVCDSRMPMPALLPPITQQPSIG
jgi:hypothetical protein